MAYLFNKPPINRGLLGGMNTSLNDYFEGFRFLPKRKISEDFALDAFGFREATVLKTFLKDSTIWL